MSADTGEPDRPTNRLRARTATGVAVGAWCTLPGPSITEVVALTGPDYVCIDCQHGLVDYVALVPMLQAMARTGVTSVVRVVDSNPAGIGKVLDAGAEAVIVPMIETRAQAEIVASACRYPPRGTRSYGPVRAATVIGSGDIEVIDAHTMCFVMIETEQGVSNADEICATPGIDGVYIGPADLAISLGERPGGLIPGRHADAVARVLDRCRAHGIVPAIHSYDGASARAYAEMGFRMVTFGVDVRLLREAVARELEAARATGRS